MLMVEAFGELLHHLEGNSALLETASQKMLWRARICLFQACLRTLLDQDEDGSWEGLPEQTSYAILALAEAQKCSLFNEVAVQLQTAIHRGARFLETHKVGPGEQGWTSKAAYRVEFVAEAYELAALNLAALGSKATGAGVSVAKSLTGPEFEAYIAALKRAPLFSEMPEWKLRASLFESNLFVPMLRDQNDEFETADDKYLDMIAFTWVSLDNRSNSCLSTARLYAMMLTSLQSAQAEDISQAGAAPAVPDASELCRLMEAVAKQTPHNNKSLTADLNGSGLPDINGKFETSIGRFIVHVLNLVPVVA
ncbi:hypothetical protein ACKVWC_005809 [Pyricularia oryzae]